MIKHNPFSLEGKRILITGASSGIGRATAIECAKLGAQLIITGRNEERLNSTFDSLEHTGHKQIIADLSKNDEIIRVSKSIENIDGFVSCAGINKMMPVQFIKKEDIDMLLETNTIAPILLTQGLLKNKKFNKPSSIVFVASLAGYHTSTMGNSAYGVSKAGLYAFMKYAANELSHKGIRCNSIHPGVINTAMTKSDREFSEDDLKMKMSKYPLQRFGEPEDVAYAIIYYLSNASAWVTGTSLPIDGGISLRE